MQPLQLIPGVVLVRDAQGRLPNAAQLRRAGFRISSAVQEDRDAPPAARPDPLSPVAVLAREKIDRIHDGD